MIFLPQIHKTDCKQENNFWYGTTFGKKGKQICIEV